MKERIKWLLVGVGVMYAMQFMFLELIGFFMPPSGSVEVYNLMATIVYTSGAFLVGGFVVGLMAERILIVEPALAAVAALLLDVLTTQAGWLRGVFQISIAVEEAKYGMAFAIGAVAIVAAIAGGLAGERWALPGENWVGRVLLAFGLTGLLLGPSPLVGHFLPLAYSILIWLALLGGILIAAYKYGRRPQYLKEISIHPESRKSSKTGGRPGVHAERGTMIHLASG